MNQTAHSAGKTETSLRRILVVEDDPTTATLFQMLLERKGYDVDIAHSFESGRDLITTKRFDLFIGDIMLPDGNGLDLMPIVAKTQHIPGLAISGLNSADDLRRSREAGYAHHFPKPVNIISLLEWIRNLMGQTMQ